MNLSRRHKILLAAAIVHSLKAIAFAIISYWMMELVYGPLRISLLWWVVIVMVGFAVAFIPVIGRLRQASP